MFPSFFIPTDFSRSNIFNHFSLLQHVTAIQLSIMSTNKNPENKTRCNYLVCEASVFDFLTMTTTYTCAGCVISKSRRHACGKSTTIGWKASQHVWVTSRSGEGSELFWLRNTASTSRACSRHATSSTWLAGTTVVVAVDHPDGASKGQYVWYMHQTKRLERYHLIIYYITY